MIVESRLPTITEFQALRGSTGWDPLSDEVVRRALSNTLYSVCAMDNDSAVGMGRIIGDGGAYFYIQDVIVLPEHQGKGIGRQIMESLEKWLAANAQNNAFIGLMSAAGKAEFYSKFEYLTRPTSGPGMFKTVKK